MKITCPNCCDAIVSTQVNVTADIAVCPRCEEAFAISDLVAMGAGTDDFDISQPPRGAWFEETGTGWRIGASTRSGLAYFLVPFMCVWSGFSLGGIYGMQIAAGKFDLGQSLFGIPFVLGTLLFGSFAAMSACGKVIVSKEHQDGRVFTGVGPLGWTRRFDWASISAVEEEVVFHTEPGSNGTVIALVGQLRHKVKFGSMLSEPRRFYLTQGLRKLLAARPPG